MALEKFEYPASGTVLASWAPTAAPVFGDFANGRDLGVSEEISAGLTHYAFGSARHLTSFERRYQNASEADRASYENFCSTVGGDYFKYTDDRGVPHKVKFTKVASQWRDTFNDTWSFGFAMRGEVAAPPNLQKIPASLHRDLLFYAPLKTDLGAFGRWNVTPTFTRNSVATYIHPTTGLLTLVAANVARFESGGYLNEPLAINKCLWSEDFSNAVWVKTAMTVSGNHSGTLDPYGTQLADLLTATAANATVIQDLGTIPSSAKVASFYIKRKTGTGSIQLTLDNGATWTTVSINSSTWTRVSAGQTLADPDIGIRLVTSGDEVWVFGGHFEDGTAQANLSSYIPTTTAEVTRQPDNLSFLEDGHILRAAGSVAFVCDVIATSGGANAYQFFDATGSNGIEVLSDGNLVHGRAFSLGVSADLTGGAAFAAGVKKSVGFAWAANDFRLSVDGAEVASDASGAAPNELNGSVFQLGQDQGTRRLFGHVRDLCIFVRPLTAAEIQAVHNGIF